MTSTSTLSSSAAGSFGSTQTTTMVPIPSYQMLNHTLPVKLDRTNYILWRSQVDNVVFANGFEDFTEGSSICPEKELSPGVLNPVFIAWRRQDRTILSWIYSSLTLAIMAQIIGHNSSHCVWKALEKTFSSSSRARIMQLRLELQSTKKGSMTMIDYIMKVKAVVDNLATIGEPVSKQDQVMNLLGGLGSDYNVDVTVINIRDDTISIEAVHNMLLAFEHRLEQQSTIEEISTMSANYASSSNNRGGGRTYISSRGQHYTSNISNYRRRSRGGRYRHTRRYNSNTSEKPQCQLYGKFGHTAQVCYHRFDISYQSSQGSGNSSLNTDDAWYLDSGASHHLTQNGDNLTDSSPYKGKDKITIGNGKHLSISNTGSSHLFSNSHVFQLKKVFHVPFISANLISVAKFCSNNNVLIEFGSNSFFVMDLHTMKVFAQGRLENGLYRFPVLKNKKFTYVVVHKPPAFHSYNSRPIENKVVLWHHRLAIIPTSICSSCFADHITPTSSILPDISIISHSPSSSEILSDSSILPEFSHDIPPMSPSPVPRMTTRLMHDGIEMALDREGDGGVTPSNPKIV
ncbi:hypothetical protein POTOM_061670 [Populus tomentosa]|uniref:Retrovirus-related Pol polyprotein from transposon TNT 1-94-like beta-barrel domain-containing protein n=1 Tax=Populus tomentosa TaxID=118781 RepID=A0A8X8BZK5_POPTO|nr:hypothetical protein POTOM_061670 [Populus tomentosa]